MDVIETRIDTNSDEYKRNFEAMELLVADLKEELRKAREERPQKDVDRLKKQGKLPVRTKLDMLLDRNTPFLEIAPLAARACTTARSTRQAWWPASASWKATRCSWWPATP